MLARSGELALLALGLTGCLAERDMPCRPQTVMTTSIDLRRPVVTAPGPITLVAPAVSCLPDEAEVFSALLTLSPAPAVPPRVAFTPRVAPVFSTVAVDLTGVAPGRYRAQLFIEPALTATTFDLTVADDRRGVIGTPARAACAGLRAWTSWGALVCEDDAGVTLGLEDGGEALLPGASEAMVSGAVVWTSQPGADGGRWIERRVGAPGAGFELTHRARSGGGTPRLLASSERHLWRGSMFLHALEDGGVTTAATVLVTSRAEYRLMDGERPIELRVPDEICDTLVPSCRTEPSRGRGSIAGLGREALWLSQNAITGDLTGLRRPLTEDSGTTITGPGSQQLVADFLLATPERVATAQPLVFRDADGGGRVFVERADGLFEAWLEPARGRLVFASEQVLLFELPDGGAVAYPR